MAPLQNLPHKSFFAGIDEAGRGCLAGPVVAAAVILPAEHKISDLRDSKKLTSAKRESLQKVIKSNALAWGIGLVWQKRIDKINILQATFHAMAMAVKHLSIKPEMLLVDGNKPIPENVLCKYLNHDLPRQEAIVTGDALIPAISAASILAKTFRDRIMIKLARHWPEYGFEKHKGYGTKSHFKALETYGPTPLHRLTFKGVVNPWQSGCNG